MKRAFVVLLCVGIMAGLAVQAQTAPAWQPNTAFSVGQMVTFNGQQFKCIQAHTSQVGWEPPNTPALWQLVSGTPAPTPTPTPPPTPSPTPTPKPSPTPTPAPAPSPSPTPSGIPNWAPGVNFATGALVLFNGAEFKCLQGHTSQVGWEPPNTPALWQLISAAPAPSPTPNPNPTPTPTLPPGARLFA